MDEKLSPWTPSCNGSIRWPASAKANGDTSGVQDQRSGHLEDLLTHPYHASALPSCSSRQRRPCSI